MARVWNGGKGGQCSRRGSKGPEGDLCGNHARCLKEKGCLPCGRIDGDVPENMISSADSSPVSSVEDGDCKSNTLEVLEIDSHHLDAALDNLVKTDVPKTEMVVGEPVEKKKRGRPKGRKSTKSNDTDSVISGGDEILQEDEMNSCVSQDDIHNCLKDYLEGGNLSEMSVATARKAIEKKLNISKNDYDKKWFKTSFESLKSEMEKAEADAKKKALEAEEKKTAEQSNGVDAGNVDLGEEDEDDGNDSDSEEVACQEITVDGKTYLLDPESMKVYARESPNGFVGKYDGSQIDFSAEDSDADSDDEE